MPDEYSRSYLRLRPDITSVKTAEGVVVYSKSRGILINGPDTNAIVDTIFPLLDGTRTLSEVFKIVPEIEPAHLSHILEELRDHDILEERRQRSSAIPSEDEFRLPLEKAWVDISGDELYATLCAEAIKNAGIGRVTVEQLAEDNVPDMALGVFHGGDKTILRSFAESANRMQIPSINCAIHEDEVIVGPLTIPGRSACWNCSDLRIEANVTWNDPHSHAAGRTREPDTMLDSMIGELIARQVCEAVCWGYAQSRLVDHVIILNRLSLSTSRHRILGVPGCKVCDGPIAFKRSELNEEYHV